MSTGTAAVGTRTTVATAATAATTTTNTTTAYGISGVRNTRASLEPAFTEHGEVQGDDTLPKSEGVKGHVTARAVGEVVEEAGEAVADVEVWGSGRVDAVDDDSVGLFRRGGHVGNDVVEAGAGGNDG